MKRTDKRASSTRMTYPQAGFRAHSDGLDYEEALARWRKNNKHRMWIKGALRSFQSAGGYVPACVIKNPEQHR